ncbi:MAG: HlyD family efflux transporter periplasmic adaptor subunit [Anaerolineae bacterium]|nr:HlyD family efflux transporter periplasmic adaptor subunit [Anaerolineae bacterium]
MMPKMVRSLSCLRRFWLVVLLLLAAGCSGGAAPIPTAVPAEAEPAQTTYTVQRGTVSRTLSFTARVAPAQQAELFFRADGHLSRLLVQRGDPVREGDLLAELEMADLQRQLEAARLDWQQAQIENTHEISRTLLALQDKQLALARARAVNPDPAVLRAEIELTRSQEALAYAREEYRKALERPWEPQDVRQAYAHQVTEAERTLALAQAAYDDAVQERAYTLRQLELAVAQAELDYRKALAGPDPRLEQKVQQLEAQVAERQIVAPFDGIVLAISATPGKSVSAYQAVLVVGDPARLELRAELSAEEMRDLAVGQEVTFTSAGFPGRTFRGQVRQLPYGWGGTVEETDRAVHIAPAPDTPTLELGAVVQVALVLEEKENVLWLPPAALQTFRERTFVIVQQADGVQRRVDVVIGIEGAERVEIVSGLEEGQIVVGP